MRTILFVSQDTAFLTRLRTIFAGRGKGKPVRIRMSASLKFRTAVRRVVILDEDHTRDDTVELILALRRHGCNDVFVAVREKTLEKQARYIRTDDSLARHVLDKSLPETEEGDDLLYRPLEYINYT